MKKIIVLLLLCLPLTTYAGGGDLAKKIAELGKRVLAESPTTWRSFTEAAELSLRMQTRAGEELAAEIAKLNSEFAARQARIAANPAEFEALLHKAQGSSLEVLSPQLSKDALMILLTLDAYGPKPKNEFVKNLDYSDGVRPTVTTTQDFYVREGIGNAVTKVYIPAGSRVQLEGILTPHALDTYISDWVKYVASVIERQGPRESELREMARRPYLAKDFIFTLKDLGNLIISPQGSQVFSPTFLIYSGAGEVTPAVVSRIPLRIMYSNGGMESLPAGTAIQMRRNSSGGPNTVDVGYYAFPNIDLRFFLPVNFSGGPFAGSVRKELFTREKVKGKTVYHPKMLMLWRDDNLHETCIIGPKNTLAYVREGRTDEAYYELVDQPILFSDFQEAMKIELPPQEELLAKLPPESLSDYRVFDPHAVKMVGEETEFGGDFQTLQMVFGNSPLIRKSIRRGMENGFSRADMQELSDQLSQRPQERNATQKAEVDAQPKQPEAEQPTSQALLLAQLKEEQHINPIPEKFRFKHFNSRIHKGNNKYTMYQAVEDFTLPDGREVHSGDYLDVTGGALAIRTRDNVFDMFEPYAKGKQKRN